MTHGVRDMAAPVFRAAATTPMRPAEARLLTLLYCRLLNSLMVKAGDDGFYFIQ